VTGRSSPSLESLNRHDFEGLIAIGAPQNEYDGEVERILQGLAAALDATAIASIIQRVFTESFEHGPSEAAVAAAVDEIWVLRGAGCLSAGARRQDAARRAPGADQGGVVRRPLLGVRGRGLGSVECVVCADCARREGRGAKRR
jgi:Domain of unknown function (DUF1871)